MKKPRAPLPSEPGYETSVAVQKVARHVIQLFEVKPGKRPCLVGNALYLRHRGSDFLLTARHVLDRQRLLGNRLFYFAEGKALANLGMCGAAFTQIDESGALDRLDLAVAAIRIRPSAVLKEALDSSAITPLGAAHRRRCVHRCRFSGIAN